MTHSAILFPTLFRRERPVAKLALLIASMSCALAQDPTATAIVQYTPSIVEIQDTFPFSRTYTFDLTSPSTLPIGSNSVWFEVIPTAAPVGSSGAGYVSVAPIPAFTGPNQTQTVTVTVSIPATALGGRYTYKILAQGWAVQTTNIGHFVNATVTAAAQLKTPPTVSISAPAAGGTYTVTALPATFPVSFAAAALGTAPTVIDSVTYELDGSSAPISLTSLTGLQSLNVAGSGTTQVATPGMHKFRVSAHNEGGTAVAESQFTVVVQGPPVVEITSPSANALFAYDANISGRTIPFNFTATSYTGNVTSVTATLNGAPISDLQLSGVANSQVAVGSVTNLQGVVPGENTLVVTAANAYGRATTTRKFYINPIGIAVNQPLSGGSFPGAFNGTIGQVTANVAFRFTSSAGPGFTIDRLYYKLDAANWIEITDPAAAPGRGVTGVSSVVATGSLVNVGIGSHTLFVRAVSSGVTVEASAIFSVTAPATAGATITGVVFFDGNQNGLRDWKTGSPEPRTDERGIDGVGVTLTSLSAVVSPQVVRTDARGVYSFTNLPAGSYHVLVNSIPGFVPTALPNGTVPANGQIITLGTPLVEALPSGLALNLGGLSGAIAQGFTIGYWKNNIEKNLKDRGGAQLTAQQIETYTLNIAGSVSPVMAGLALEPFALIDEAGAVEILDSNSSEPVDLLRKQLLASEYNYASGAYLNGNAGLTYYFVYWGEYVLNNASSFTTQEIIYAKDWFDAYNNTHGGALRAPNGR